MRTLRECLKKQNLRLLTHSHINSSPRIQGPSPNLSCNVDARKKLSTFAVTRGRGGRVRREGKKGGGEEKVREGGKGRGGGRGREGARGGGQKKKEKK